MNQVLLKGVAARDARVGTGERGGWWVVDVQPEGETASYPVWHFGDAPAPRRGDAVDLVGRLGWTKGCDGAWSLRIVADEVTVGAAQRRNGNGGAGGRVGAGPRRNTGGGAPRQDRGGGSDIHF